MPLYHLRGSSPHLLLASLTLYTALGQAADIQGMGQPRPAQCEAPTALITKIKACDRLVQAQDLSIKNLKTMNKKYEAKIIELSSPPLIPGWVLPVIIFFGGVYVGSKL